MMHQFQPACNTLLSYILYSRRLQAKPSQEGSSFCCRCSAPAVRTRVQDPTSTARLLQMQARASPRTTQKRTSHPRTITAQPPATQVAPGLAVARRLSGTGSKNTRECWRLQLNTSMTWRPSWSACAWKSGVSTVAGNTCPRHPFRRCCPVQAPPTAHGHYRYGGPGPQTKSWVSV